MSELNSNGTAPHMRDIYDAASIYGRTKYAGILIGIDVNYSPSGNAYNIYSYEPFNDNARCRVRFKVPMDTKLMDFLTPWRNRVKQSSNT